MNITKIGHATLLVEVRGVRLLIDPGNYAVIPALEHVDVILITHEHGDHFDPLAIKRIMALNPDCEIITHKGMATLCQEYVLTYTTIKEDEVLSRKGVTIESIGHTHECIHASLPDIYNTGFLIDNYLFHPGDGFIVPNKKVEVLALPVAAPWMSLREGVAYAQKVKPKAVFPIHDGMLLPDRRTSTRRVPANVLEKDGIRYVDMQDGWENEF
jgi:L-ascorbate metabolism protein UlaG (beta-lactamase superfamily)